MSPRTRILSTLGKAPSTASRASRLLWTSESRATVGPMPGSGVDAFVGVDEENPQGGGNRNGDEEPEDTSQITTTHKGDDDQHRGQVDRVAEHLRRNEVVHDVRDDEVEDEHQHDFARGLRDKPAAGDRRGGAEKGPR